MTRAELEALINAEPLEACVRALEGMPEAERAKLGAAAVAKFKAIVKGVGPAYFMFLDPNDDSYVPGAPVSLDAFRTAQAAVLLTASFSQWKSVRRYGLPSDDLALRILRHRRVTWLNEMVALICESDDRFNLRWNLIRGLVREGLCALPRVDDTSTGCWER